MRTLIHQRVFSANLIVLSLLINTAVKANDAFEKERWHSRPIVLIHFEKNKPEWQEKIIRQFYNSKKELIDRNNIIFLCSPVSCQKLNLDSKKWTQVKIKPRRVAKSFSISKDSVVLIGKDGGIKMKRSQFVDPKEIFKLVDSMPMRIREKKERKN